MPVTVQFATNRRPSGPTETWQSYGSDMIPGTDLDDAIYGTAFVNEVDLTADTVGAITNIQDTRRGRFSSQAAGDLANAGRNLLIFIHGFDNSFDNAITRAAFNREWLAAAGGPDASTAVVAFSWPSQGRLIGLPLGAPYRSDQHAAERSARHLMRFFKNLAPIVATARKSGRRVFLLAHSMGNWALQAAIEAWFAENGGDVVLFDQAFLAAADERFDSFDTANGGRLGGLARLSHRTTILFSHNDAVLHASAFLNLKRRLGQDGPRAREDATRFPPTRYGMVDCSNHNDFAFNVTSSHQYYRRSPAVRTLIAAAMARPSV